MRSFSAFQPVVSGGTPNEMRTATFSMWLRANARAVKHPYDPSKWRTARPWLTYNEVLAELKSFKKRSLGKLLFGGNVFLTDEDVCRAVEYEAYCTKHISAEEIKSMVFEFYTFVKNGSAEKKEVLERINAEFAVRGRGVVLQSDKMWKTAFKCFSINSQISLEPRIHENRVAELILEMFEPGEVRITARDIYRAVAPTLLRMGAPLGERSVLFERAVSITGLWLDRVDHEAQIQKIVDKYYIRHPLAVESLERLQHVVRFCHVRVPSHYKVWQTLNLNIAPKHDYDRDDYEQAVGEEFHDPPFLSPLQKPFFSYKVPYPYVRKRQALPWRDIMNQCERGRKTTDDDTINKINLYLKDKGFVPYHPSHDVFDVIRVQGLTWKAE